MNEALKLKSSIISCFNKAADEITELNGSKQREIQGILLNWGVDIWYNEADRYYYFGHAHTLNSTQIPRDDLYDFCAQFADQDKAYEIIKYVKETGMVL